MSIELVKTLSHTLSDSDLSDAINILVAAKKERQANQLLEMKSVLSAGDAVEFYHSARKEYIRGTVKKVKTKKALVLEDLQLGQGPGMTWDVPMGMLRKGMANSALQPKSSCCERTSQIVSQSILGLLISELIRASPFAPLALVRK